MNWITQARSALAAFFVSLWGGSALIGSCRGTDYHFAAIITTLFFTSASSVLFMAAISEYEP